MNNLRGDESAAEAATATNAQDIMVKAAVWYATVMGWPVIPLHTPNEGGCSCRRPDCDKIGKHPRIKDWTNRATIDEATIREWWGQWPNANVGVLTGAKSGIVVIDLDGEAGKAEFVTMNRTRAEWDHTPKSALVNTGGGLHVYLTDPTGGGIPCSIRRLGDHIDVRGEGGYIIAPPSLHYTGKRYAWRNRPSGPDEIEPPPGWLLELLTEGDATGAGVDEPRPSPLAAVAPETAQSATWNGGRVDHGRRNVALFKFGCGLRGRGWEHGAIEAELARVNAEFCDPPLSAGEVAAIAASAAQYAVNQRPSDPLWFGEADVKAVCRELEAADAGSRHLAAANRKLAELKIKTGRNAGQPAKVGRLTHVRVAWVFCAMRKRIAMTGGDVSTVWIRGVSGVRDNRLIDAAIELLAVLRWVVVINPNWSRKYHKSKNYRIGPHAPGETAGTHLAA